jgi:hypothetical protein
MPFINVTVCAAKSAGRCGSRLLAPRRNSARLSVAGGSLMRLVRARLASTSVCVNVSKSSSETLANRCRHTATNDSSAPFANRELNETRNDSGVTVEVNIRAYAVHSVSVASLYSLACAPKNRRSASSERCVSPSDSILLPQSAHDSAAGLFLAAAWTDSLDRSRTARPRSLASLGEPFARPQFSMALAAYSRARASMSCGVHCPVGVVDAQAASRTATTKQRTPTGLLCSMPAPCGSALLAE